MKLNIGPTIGLVSLVATCIYLLTVLHGQYESRFVPGFKPSMAFPLVTLVCCLVAVYFMSKKRTLYK